MDEPSSQSSIDENFYKTDRSNDRSIHLLRINSTRNSQKCIQSPNLISSIIYNTHSINQRNLTNSRYNARLDIHGDMRASIDARTFSFSLTSKYSPIVLEQQQRIPGFVGDPRRWLVAEQRRRACTTTNENNELRSSCSLIRLFHS